MLTNVSKYHQLRVGVKLSIGDVLIFALSSKTLPYCAMISRITDRHYLLNLAVWRVCLQRHQDVYCIILHHIILYCIILYYIILYGIILYDIV